MVTYCSTHACSQLVGEQYEYRSNQGLTYDELGEADSRMLSYGELRLLF